MGALTTQHNVSSKKIEALISIMAAGPQVECPLKEIFAPGVYYREITIPADTVVVGHEHKTKHLNIVLTGLAEVVVNGQRFLAQAGDVFVSEAGDRKALHALEETRWATIHPTDETDPEKLEALLINKHEPSIEGPQGQEVLA